MRNRAKCKLCLEIIESFHVHDYVECKCGEIAIDGGLDYLRASAKDWRNFLRVDDDNNEIIVTVKDDPMVATFDNSKELPPPSKEEKLKMLDEMIKNIEHLPQHAMIQPVNHYDLLSALMLLSSILKE